MPVLGIPMYQVKTLAGLWRDVSKHEYEDHLGIKQIVHHVLGEQIYDWELVRTDDGARLIENPNKASQSTQTAASDRPAWNYYGAVESGMEPPDSHAAPPSIVDSVLTDEQQRTIERAAEAVDAYGNTQIGVKLRAIRQAAKDKP